MKILPTTADIIYYYACTLKIELYFFYKEVHCSQVCKAAKKQQKTTLRQHIICVIPCWQDLIFARVLVISSKQTAKIITFIVGLAGVSGDRKYLPSHGNRLTACVLGRGRAYAVTHGVHDRLMWTRLCAHHLCLILSTFLHPHNTVPLFSILHDDLLWGARLFMIFFCSLWALFFIPTAAVEQNLLHRHRCGAFFWVTARPYIRVCDVCDIYHGQESQPAQCDSR